jgi:hypothetical protein
MGSHSDLYGALSHLDLYGALSHLDLYGALSHLVTWSLGHLVTWSLGTWSLITTFSDTLLGPPHGAAERRKRSKKFFALFFCQQVGFSSLGQVTLSLVWIH